MASPKALHSAECSRWRLRRLCVPLRGWRIRAVSTSHITLTSGLSCYHHHPLSHVKSQVLFIWSESAETSEMFGKEFRGSISARDRRPTSLATSQRLDLEDGPDGGIEALLEDAASNLLTLRVKSRQLLLFDGACSHSFISNPAPKCNINKLWLSSSRSDPDVLRKTMSFHPLLKEQRKHALTAHGSLRSQEAAAPNSFIENANSSSASQDHSARKHVQYCLHYSGLSHSSAS